MTSVELPDWASGVGVVDRAVTLAGAGTACPAGQAVGPFDTSQLSSLTVVVTPPVGSGAERMMLSLEWSEGINTVSTDHITYADQPAYAGALQVLQWQVPVRGSLVRVRARGTTANAQTVAVIGSTRDVTQSDLSFRPSGAGGGFGALTGRLLLNTGSTAIGAGAGSATFYVPPVARAVRLWVGGTFATGYVQLVSPEYYAGAMTGQFIGFLDRVAGNQNFDPVNVPGMGLELTVHNSDAAAKNFNISVWDVS